MMMKANRPIEINVTATRETCRDRGHPTIVAMKACNPFFGFWGEVSVGSAIMHPCCCYLLKDTVLALYLFALGFRPLLNLHPHDFLVGIDSFVARLYQVSKRNICFFHSCLLYTSDA